MALTRLPVVLAGLLVAFGATRRGVSAQNVSAPSSFPHAYPGMPTTGYGTNWQNYFEVTSPLPNVTKPLGVRSFAGNVGVNRDGHPNATLFFWAFEKTNGSLTAANTTDPWIIWLNGGPGSSSMIGLMTENGPIQVTGTYSIVENEFSWNKQADIFWVDQPVGTGYSTSDATGYVPDEDQMGEDFVRVALLKADILLIFAPSNQVQFLSNIVKIFPSLGKRPLYLAGESYAGTYIPYITKAIFSTPNPPVKLAKITVGDGTLGDAATFEQVPTLTTIETYPQLISYDPDVYEYFREQQHLCGYDLNFTYPETAHFPTLNDPSFGSTIDADAARFKSLKQLVAQNGRYASSVEDAESKRELAMREENRQAWKRDLSGRPNGTIDPYYGCYIYFELLDYATNFSFPWNGPLGGPNSIDVYDIPDALNPEVASDPSVFLNDNQTRAALHAPTSKDWVMSFDFPFGTDGHGNALGDPSPAPMVFLTELATNASKNNVGIVFYSGNDDSLVAHRGTESEFIWYVDGFVISLLVVQLFQNMTFGGIQGFTRKPATPWTDDDGNFAGIVHQERNLTFVLFKGAGHLVPNSVPAAAAVFLREFVLGSNNTGFVDTSGNVVGGEESSLAGDFLPGGTVIYFGSGADATTTASTVIPGATVASWNAFIASETSQAAAEASHSTASTTKSSAVHAVGGFGGILGAIMLSLVILL
ncbi:Carboxypeptidase [Mycena chlorophos]|uniref:Carboxypeptidase n=1 Tax=Mycena chlorophos TaxID=658473 RepID=A0A8H6VW21_MYCCL|nr:Carboxypeptidase [Mycena chlorophos]